MGRNAVNKNHTTNKPPAAAATTTTKQQQQQDSIEEKLNSSSNSGHRFRWLVLGISILVGIIAVAAYAIVVRNGWEKQVENAFREVKRKVAPTTFAQPQHAAGVKVVDYARHDLPPLRVGERVVELMSGMHFDALLQDTPDEMRPPSIILFGGFETCPNLEKKLKYRATAETILPSRERLLIAFYDMDANPKRGWHVFTPEMDLTKRFGVSKCGELVYAPRKCDGYTKWCEKPTKDPKVSVVGCEDYVDNCASLIKKWDEARDGPWVEWVQKLVEEDGEPEISPVLGSYQDQVRWILERDETTTDNEVRNYFLVEAFPAFTETGFVAMPIPDEFQNWIMDFWQSRKRARVHEGWHAASTQMSFHELPTSFVSLDQIGHQRDVMANKILKPIVEKWSGIPDLELTSFYGIREYKKGHWLRNHIDRIDTHVLSVTFTLGKVNESDPNQLLTEEQVDKLPKWPLEVISYDGKIYRHEHPPNVMILYESSKLAHGRPYKNQGPGHLGAFLHYKPRTMHSDSKWDGIATFARDHQAASTRRGTYRSTQVREPVTPKFTSQRYADLTGFESSKDMNKNNKRRRGGNGQKSVSVVIENDGEDKMDVAWVNPDSHTPQVVGVLPSKTSIQMDSFIGHRFVWLMHEADKPVASFKIEDGSVHYTFRGSTKV